MNGFKQVQLTDHEFAEFLHKKDPNWVYRSLGNSNSFRDSKGNLLAVVFYDNARMTKRIFIPDTLEVK